MCDLSRKIAENVPTGDILYFAPVLKKQLHAKNAQKLRLEGFVQTMKKLGKSYRVVTDTEELSNYGGIVCATDHYVLQALKHLGYPPDVQIAGFDNVSVLKNVTVKVLSVDYSTDKIAEESINYILGRRYTSEIEHSLVYN